MILLNFSHPITATQRVQIQTSANQAIACTLNLAPGFTVGVTDLFLYSPAYCGMLARRKNKTLG